jgi:hypothetical protein
MQYEQTALWAHTVGRQEADAYAKARWRLQTAYARFRENASVIAGEIHRDVPDLTVHDISHIDALWATASVLVGARMDQPLSFDVNPAEAFVLGGGFLLHDLGNGLAAYMNGARDVMSGPAWEAAVQFFHRKHHGRPASAAALASPDELVRRAALLERLRHLHARQAERLASDAIGQHQPIYLLEDAELRKVYGSFIGRVAASHWWNLEEVAARFANPVPPTAGFPWRVDLLKVALTLRLADAAQIDFRRAPGLLMEVRDLSPESKPHWEFQERILGPDILDERLLYTSREPFPYAMREAWWLCFDTLQMIDRELRDVDALLASRKSSWRFAARGVAYVEQAHRLAKNAIEVAGWDPVDTRFRITNAARVIETLGGEQLYGDDTLAAVRELLSNAADAVRARRQLEGEAYSDGGVVLRAWEDTDGSWLEVEDNGIGMKPSVLTGPLLEFGETYWRSLQAARELPVLVSSGFEPAGRFGIGFFSVFMLGSRVEVVTRFYRDAVDATRILEIDGVRSRPVLRLGDERQPRERLAKGGTRVRVRLAQPLADLATAMLLAVRPSLRSWLERDEPATQPLDPSPLARLRRAAGAILRPVRGARQGNAATVVQSSAEEYNLFAAAAAEYLDYTAVMMDVPFYVAIDSADTRGVKVTQEDEWRTASDSEFVRRLSGGSLDLEQLAVSSNDEPESYLIGPAERPVGRLFAPWGRGRLNGSDQVGVVTAGGFRTSAARAHFAGLLSGRPTTAARNLAVPDLTPEMLADWLARHEKKLCSTISWESDVLMATLMVRLGLRPQHLDVVGPGYSARRFASMKWESHVVIALCVPPNRFNTYADVVFAPFGTQPFLELQPGRDWIETLLPPPDLSYGGPLAEHLLELLAEQWSIPLAEVKAHSVIPHEWIEIGDAMRVYDETPPPASPRLADRWRAPYCILGDPPAPTDKRTRKLKQSHSKR